MAELLQEIINRAAERWPDNTALIEADTGISINYASLRGKTDAAALALLEAGLTGGRKVGLLSRNSIDSVAALFSVFRAGCVAVPLNTSLSSRDIIYQAGDCALDALYFDGYNLEKADDICGTVSSVRHRLYGKDLMDRRGVSAAPRAGGSPDDMAAIIYTSGTTRVPLGVMLSHKNLLSNNRSIAGYLGLTDKSSVCCILPLYYIYGLSLIFSHFLVGGTVVLDNRFTYPNAVLDAMERYRVKGFAGVSSHYALLLDRSDIRDRSLSDLEYFTQAGDCMPEHITKEFLELFPGKKFFIMYGQTEAAPRLTYLDPLKVKSKPCSIGGAVPGVEIRVVNDRGEECAPMEEGEITAKGPNIMLGYWGNPRETDAVLKDGWLRTGDRAYRDEEGDLFIVGREKNFIKVGANRVNPLEIEHFILEDDNILEAAVVGVCDDILGCRLKLYVAPKKGASVFSDDIMSRCRVALPTYKTPSQIEVLDSLPKNDSGKIDKEKLEKIT